MAEMFEYYRAGENYQEVFKELASEPSSWDSPNYINQKSQVKLVKMTPNASPYEFAKALLGNAQTHGPALCFDTGKTRLVPIRKVVGVEAIRNENKGAKKWKTQYTVINIDTRAEIKSFDKQALAEKFAKSYAQQHEVYVTIVVEKVLDNLPPTLVSYKPKYKTERKTVPLWGFVGWAPN